MKHTLLITLLSIAMNFSITDVLAQSQHEPYTSLFSQTKLSEKESLVLSALQKGYPQNRIRFARETAVKGFYEVILGEGVSYVFITPETIEKLDQINEKNRDLYFKHWIFGGVFYDMAQQKDLTAPLKALAQMIDVTKLPLELSITREKGTPQHSLFVFTDPRCPFCKQLEESLSKLNNVRIHTFLMPLAVLHPDAKEIAARIWCSANQAQAFEDFMLKGVAPQTKAACSTPLTEIERLAASLGVKGTPTLFFENGERVTGAISVEAIEKKLQALSQMKKTISKESK